MSLLTEKMAVEYRLFLQKNGKCAAALFVNQEDHVQHQESIDEFVRDVAPNIEVKVSAFVPVGSLFFVRMPETPMIIRRMPE